MIRRIPASQIKKAGHFGPPQGDWLNNSDVRFVWLHRPHLRLGEKVVAKARRWAQTRLPVLKGVKRGRPLRIPPGRPKSREGEGSLRAPFGAMKQARQRLKYSSFASIVPETEHHRHECR